MAEFRVGEVNGELHKPVHHMNKWVSEQLYNMAIMYLLFFSTI
jgi:hypothetical protein